MFLLSSELVNKPLVITIRTSLSGIFINPDNQRENQFILIYLVSTKDCLNFFSELILIVIRFFFILTQFCINVT